MLIQTLDPKKYKRFFAFGCSFTNYIWPTWADIIGREIPYYENWGMGGAGNQFIFNSVIECNQRYKFTQDDLVIIMWTSCSREDRYVDNNWLVAASENREQVYGHKWMKKYGDENRGIMIRDFASIRAIQQILKGSSADWANFNGPPLVRFNIKQATKDLNDNRVTLNDIERRWTSAQKGLVNGVISDDTYMEGQDIIELYRDIFTNIKDPLLERVLQNTSRPKFGDKHPTPKESLDYINSVLPNSLTADEFVDHWEQQISNIIVPRFIKPEIVRL
jgi:DNA-binding protein Fis